MKTLKRRLVRLEGLLPPPTPEIILGVPRSAPLFDRWDQLAAAALPLLTADEQGRVHQALKQLHEAQSGPYSIWFHGVLLGWSRLPPLAPCVMKDLLLTWLNPAVSTAFICVGCGLDFPFRYGPPIDAAKSFLVSSENQGSPWRLPEFFTACPHCDLPGTDVVTPDDVEQQDYAWKKRDGYVRVPPRSPR